VVPDGTGSVMIMPFTATSLGRVCTAAWHPVPLQARARASAWLPAGGARGNGAHPLLVVCVRAQTAEQAVSIVALLQHLHGPAQLLSSAQLRQGFERVSASTMRPFSALGGRVGRVEFIGAGRWRMCVMMQALERMEDLQQTDVPAALSIFKSRFVAPAIEAG
jgi:hypothetical protein